MVAAVLSVVLIKYVKFNSLIAAVGISIVGVGAVSKLLSWIGQRRDDHQRKQLLKLDVIVDDKGVSIRNAERCLVHIWADVEHISRNGDRFAFKFRDRSVLPVYSSDLVGGEAFDGVGNYVIEKIRAHGLQPPKYYRFIFDDRPRSTEFFSVVFDEMGYRIFSGEHEIWLSWNRFNGLSVENGEVLMEIADLDSMPSLSLTEFRTHETLQAFVDFASQNIANSRLH